MIARRHGATRVIAGAVGIVSVLLAFFLDAVLDFFLQWGLLWLWATL